MARIFLERRGLDDELQRLLDRLTTRDDLAGASAECNVSLDVVETATSIEVVMDLAGVAADSVQVVLAHDTLLITGRKNDLVNVAGWFHAKGITFDVLASLFDAAILPVENTAADDLFETHIVPALDRVLEKRDDAGMAALAAGG